MNFVTYVSDMHQLSLAREYGVKEVLLAESKLSRIGRNTFENIFQLAKNAREMGIKTVLVWDTLATEKDFQQQRNYFETLDIIHFDCVRAQDPGVCHYLKSKNISLQLSLENGNHNLRGIQKWIDIFKENLDKVILSIELPESKIITYCQELKVAVEVLGAGPILLFYSPRKLLGAQLQEKDHQIRSDRFIEALAESEESPHKGFPVIENKHGTFMFHIKNFFILEHCHKLFDNGLHSVRIDLTDNNMSFLASFYSFLQDKLSLAELKKEYAKDTIRGFYHINKSDVLFKKLKNHRIQRKDDSYLGEVVDAIKGRFVIMTLKSSELAPGMEVQYLTPEGKVLDSKIEAIWDLDQKQIVDAREGDTVMVNFRNGVLTKSQVYCK